MKCYVKATVAREVMRAYLSAFPILLPFLPTACGQFLNPIARGRYNCSLRPVVRKNEQIGESQAGRGRRGWEQLGEDRDRVRTITILPSRVSCSLFGEIKVHPACWEAAAHTASAPCKSYWAASARAW